MDSEALKFRAQTASGRFVAITADFAGYSTVHLHQISRRQGLRLLQNPVSVRLRTQDSLFDH